MVADYHSHYWNHQFRQVVDKQAVGYADGSVGLISLPEFIELDLSDFIDVAVLSLE